MSESKSSTAATQKKSQADVAKDIRRIRKGYTAAVSELKTVRDRAIGAAYSRFGETHNRKELNSSVREARQAYTAAASEAADTRDSQIADAYSALS